MSDFDVEFEKLAEQVARDAQSAESLADKVDAMKALQPYYALRRKMKVPGTEEGTMDDLRKRIRLVDTAATSRSGIEDGDAEHAA